MNALAIQIFLLLFSLVRSGRQPQLEEDARFISRMARDLPVAKAAVCIVGAPRGLARRKGSMGLASTPGVVANIREAILLGLAPRYSGVELALFGLIHEVDVAQEHFGGFKTMFEKDEVSNFPRVLYLCTPNENQT